MMPDRVGPMAGAAVKITATKLIARPRCWGG